MPWKEVNLMSLRKEFVQLASQEDICMRSLCCRFAISPKTGYKWLRRHEAAGAEALNDISRRPHNSPNRTPPETEEAIVRLRRLHPAWGARKLRARLTVLDPRAWPSISTITTILQRHGLVNSAESLKHKAWQRFEADSSNVLWQMDFKGPFPTGSDLCHPLTVLDDYSRFNLGLYACVNQTGLTVQEHLTSIFRRYGMPTCMLTDNGAPWGCFEDQCYHTKLTVWLLRLGIDMRHSRAYHPQTMGKDERFHRTLKAEVITGRYFEDLIACQHHFDQWRMVYNLERPHEALDWKVPASRYQISQRTFPETLPAIEYAPGDHVRKVQSRGEISFHNREFKIGKAFQGLPVALKPTLRDGVFDVVFTHHKITEIDLDSNSKH